MYACLCARIVVHACTLARVLASVFTVRHNCVYALVLSVPICTQVTMRRGAQSLSTPSLGSVRHACLHARTHACIHACMRASEHAQSHHRWAQYIYSHARMQTRTRTTCVHEHALTHTLMHVCKRTRMQAHAAYIGTGELDSKLAIPFPVYKNDSHQFEHTRVHYWRHGHARARTHARMHARTHTTLNRCRA